MPQTPNGRSSSATGPTGHARSGSLSIPSTGPASHAAMSPFHGAKSPPNTSHVPCKFFRQGQCQAGNSCPFSHDLAAAAENICKYFAKGNCKFGPKCANIHILPDGRRINYGKNGVTFSTPSHRLPYTSGPSNLTTTFTTGHEMPLYGPSTPGYGGYSHLATSDEAYHTVGRQPSFDSGIPIIGTTPAYSPNGSAYGSPRDGDTRFDIGHSSVNKGLSAMDAPSLLRLTQMAVLMQLCIPTVLFPLPCPANLVLHRPRRTHPHEVTKPLRLYKCQLTLLVIT